MQGDPPLQLGAEGPLDVCWGGADRCPQVDSGMRWRVSCFEDIVALRDVLVWAVASPTPAPDLLGAPPPPVLCQLCPWQLWARRCGGAGGSAARARRRWLRS